MNIAVIGLGLIGGSLAKTLRQRTDDKIFVYDKNEEVMLKAKLLDIYDDELTDENIGSVDVMFIALYPKSAISHIIEKIAKLKSGSIVLDCCGNKSDVCDCFMKLKDKYPSIEFIGFHPMAGREFSGLSYSVSGLFDNASAIIIPIKTGFPALIKIKGVLNVLGFKKVVTTTSEEHDRMISYTSQLAHIVSSAYINNEKAVQHEGFSAGSFKDMTRVAKLNADMWSELFLENADNISDDLGSLIKNLVNFKDSIDNRDEKRLKKLLEEGSKMKVLSETEEDGFFNS